MSRIKVGVLGATGMVGQRFVQLLAAHPWFELVALAASDRSMGQSYGDACRWILDTPMPESVHGMVIQPCQPALECRVVFSALPADIAGSVEEAFALAGYVVSSNASSHRCAPDVPLMVPEVNPDHLGLLPLQRQRRGWPGLLVTNPNCSTTHLVLALKPLWEAFGLRRVLVTTMQAVSGAGYPGVPSLDILDNILPYIAGEEEKVEWEPRKLLGRFDGEGVELADLQLSAHCNRVAVTDSHVECISLELARPASLDQVRDALASFRALPQELGLPSAPPRPVLVRREPDRPQPRRDRMAGGGMATVVGRLRPCPLMGYKFIVLGHNTVRGAAGGAILNAELLSAQGYLD